MKYEIYAEWLDQNQHRVFPMADDMSAEDITGSYVIPTSFMVDIFLCVPPGYDTSKFYVLNITARRYSSDVCIGYNDGTIDVIVGYFRSIPFDQEINTTYTFEAEPQTSSTARALELTAGVLIVGSTEALLSKPGHWTFDVEETALLPTRIVEGLAGVTSLTLENDIFTGNIALKEGAGITITPSYDSVHDQTVITIAADLGALEDLPIPLTSDASIIANLTKMYGQPITSINGIQPDDTGDFTLKAVDCTKIERVTNGLSIENPCSMPCCEKEVLDDVYESISQINQRYARLEGYYQSISRNVNELQARMIALEI